MSGKAIFAGLVIGQFGITADDLAYWKSRDIQVLGEGADYSVYPLHPDFISCVGFVSKKARLPTAGIQAGGEYIRQNIRPKPMDTALMLRGLNNSNKQITGTAGSGKSVTMEWMIDAAEKLGKNWRRIIQFKQHDIYETRGFPVLNIAKYMPDPFSDKAGFVAAFAVSFPISQTGIQANQVPAELDLLLSKSNSWAEFDKVAEQEEATARQKKASNTLAVIATIQNNTRLLRHTAGTFTLDDLIPYDNVVFDFSGLEHEEAKAFYAELLLRQLWRRMKRSWWDEARAACVKRGGDAVIIVDELHYLLKYSLGTYHSIVQEIAALGRAKGQLWTATQNYSDIPALVRNQLDVQFAFSSKHNQDHLALLALEPMLSWAVSGLGEHEFVRIDNNMHDTVYIYKINPSKLQDYPRRELMSEEAKPQQKPPESKAFIREWIAKEDAIHRSRLARLWVEKYGGDVQKVRDSLASPIKEMVNSGELDFMGVQMGANIANMLYFHEENTPESGLHRWGIYHIAQQEEKKGREIVHIAKSGEDKPDMETDKEYIEWETGKKHTLADLQKRIATFAAKPFRIVCPNSKVAKAYEALKCDRVKVEVLGF